MKSALRLRGARTTSGPGTQVGSAVARSPRVLLTTIAALLVAPSGALAQTFEFDTDSFASGAQGATFSPVGWNSGPWWWNGALNVNWINGSDAVFSGVPGEVTDAHFSVDDMTFSVAGYSITQGPGAGTLTFSGGTGAHVITTISSATISAAIAGTQGFDKAGFGPLTIATGAHTLTGTINVNAGTLAVGDGFDSTALLLNLANASGAKFIVNDPELTIGALSGGGGSGGEVAFSGKLIVGGDNTDRVYAGIVTGAGMLNKTGSGRLTLPNASSSFSGAFILDGGTVSVPSVANSAFNSPLGAGSAITIRNAATLEYTGNGGQNMNRTITLDGSAGGRIVADVPVGNAGLTLSGVINEINGAAVLRVRSTNIGFLRLSNANAFTGGLIIEEGNVIVNGVANSGTNSPLGRSGTITLGSSGTTAGGFFYEGAANDSTNRPIKIDRLGTVGVSTAGTILTLSGVISNDDTHASAPQFTKAGPGILVLSANETYDDPDLAAAAGPDSNTIILGGTLRMAANSDLPAHTRVDVRTGATFDTDSTGEIIGSLTGPGSVIANGVLNLGGDNSAAVTFSGAISGAGSLVKSGAGTQTLSGVNSYAGATVISQGNLVAASLPGSALPNNVILGNGVQSGVFLIMSASNQFGPNSVLTFNNGTGRDAKFELRGTNQTVAGLSSDADDTLSIIQNQETATPGPATLTINNTGNFVWNGSVRKMAGGALDLVKNGPGTQELRNVSAQTNNFGTLTINTGRMSFNYSGATGAIVAGNIVLNAAGQLGLDGAWTLTRPISGAGTVLKLGAGTVTINSAQSYATLITQGTGSLTLATSLPNAAITNTGGTLNLNANANGSTVNANAQVNFGSSQTLTALNIGPGGLATITTSPGGVPADPEVAGWFDGESDASGVAEMMLDQFDSSHGGLPDGSVVTAEAVPEPAALSLLAAGVASLLGRRRRFMRRR